MSVNRFLLRHLCSRSNSLVSVSLRYCIAPGRRAHNLKKRKSVPWWMKKRHDKSEVVVGTEDTGTEQEDDIPIIVKYLQECSNKVDNSHALGKETSSKESIEKSLNEIKFDMDALKYTRETLDDDEDADVDTETIDLKSDTGGIKVHRSVLFGTPDPSVPPSDIPCGGCGANLHCQDTGIPGFVPQETYKGKTKEELQGVLCQRCTMLKDSNHLIHYGVDEQTYPQIVKKIKSEKALIMMVVDVTDLENSVIKEFLKRIGERRSIYIVGNKIDLIPKDETGYKHLNRIGKSLIEACLKANLNPRDNNIKHVCLVSAKTGYGIERLITKLMSDWEYKGNVYLVGTTNSGKSTLFNTFLRSDYCKSACRDIVQRATVSQWPGTTLNLLKFPIINPKGWRLYKRVNRLREMKEADIQEDMLRRSKQQQQQFGDMKNVILKESVGKTDFRSDKEIQAEEEANRPTGSQFATYKFGKQNEILPIRKWTPEDQVQSMQIVTDEHFPNSHWLFDTPGLINENQIITRLTVDELRAVLPDEILWPRVYLLKEGQVMFISGLARIDCLQGPSEFCVCVFTSSSIPVHIVSAAEADEFYSKHIGTEILGVPIGDENRLNKLPSLSGREFSITNETHLGEATADIQLSSLGWIALMLRIKRSVQLRVYTPGGYGIHLRQPCILPLAKAFKGKRVRGTQEYKRKKLLA